MDERLLRFLGCERTARVRVGEEECELRLLSARETISLRRELAQEEPADEGERALRANAALVSRSLWRGEERRFRNAEEAEETLSLGEINALVARYASLDGAGNVSAEDGRGEVEALKKAWSTRPMSG